MEIVEVTIMVPNKMVGQTNKRKITWVNIMYGHMEVERVRSHVMETKKMSLLVV